MLWTEKYRPESLKDFIGNRELVKVAINWMKIWDSGTVIFPILILHGRSGIGKTTLAKCLGREFNCAISERNASDERNVKQMRKVIQGTGIAGLDFNKRLTILDEADSISKKAQKLLVENYKVIRQPIIMLVNDMDKIIPKLKDLSLKLQMKKPTIRQKLMLAKELIEEEGLEPWDLKKIVEGSESFRDLLNNLYFDIHGLDFSDDVEGNRLELIEAMLRGEVGSERLRISPDELLRYVYQNKIRSDLRDIDIWLKIAKSTGNYRLWAYAFGALELQRFGGTVSVPKNEFRPRKHKGDGKKAVEKATGSAKKVGQKPTKPKLKHVNSLFNHA